VSLARTWAVTVTGVEGRLVEVEADLAQGLPACVIVGLPDASLSEARDRVRAAVLNTGIGWPQQRITIGLSPASLPKRGSGFDLAVAAAVLTAAGVVPAEAVHGVVLLGELGLDGRTRPVPGVLPAALAAVRLGRARLVCPTANAAEALLVTGLDVVAVSSLGQLVGVLRGECESDDATAIAEAAAAASGDDASTDAATVGATDVAVPDLADVMGQLEARRALEVAASGGHHVLLHGPPGAGKTMLAERLPGLLPPLPDEHAIEVTSVHSVAGTLRPGTPLLSRAPFVAPHHTASVAAMVGGGSRSARPGAVSLAHRGVLFLDEAPEFARQVLEALREPLESGRVTVSRSGFHTTFPARVQLVLAANPCPCGAAPASTASGSASGTGPGSVCGCTPHQRRRYAARLSGPLLDRVDLAVPVDRVDRVALLSGTADAEPTADVAARVLRARARFDRRWGARPWRSNAEIPSAALRAEAAPEPSALSLLDDALRRGALSARGLHKVLRVAWSVADLREGGGPPSVGDVREALALRTGGMWTA
jgi:magnesium chelatase family protein